MHVPGCVQRIPAHQPSAITTTARTPTLQQCIGGAGRARVRQHDEVRRWQSKPHLHAVPLCVVLADGRLESRPISPVGAALTLLLMAAAPTVQTAAAVAVSASVAASAAASAAGGAAGGGGGPAALAGAQRNSLFSTLGGAPASCEDPRSTTNGGGWTMGRLGVGSSANPCENEGGGSSQEGQSSGTSGSGTSGGGTGGGKGGGRSGRRLRASIATNGTTVANETLRKPLVVLVNSDEDEDLVQRLLVVALGKPACAPHLAVLVG